MDGVAAPFPTPKQIPTFNFFFASLHSLPFLLREISVPDAVVFLLYNEIKLHISFNSNHEFIIIIELFLSSHSPCKTRLNVIKVTRKNLIFLSIFGYYYPHNVDGDGDNGNAINRSVHCRRTVNFPSTLLLPWRCNNSSCVSNSNLTNCVCRWTNDYSTMFLVNL